MTEERSFAEPAAAARHAVLSQPEIQTTQRSGSSSSRTFIIGRGNRYYDYYSIVIVLIIGIIMLFGHWELPLALAVDHSAAAAAAAVECPVGWGASTEIRVIPADRMNDGYCDCPTTGADEPGTTACSGWDGHWPGSAAAVVDGGDTIMTTTTELSRTFSCPRQPKLNLSPSKVNDGVCDCCDGADEMAATAACPDVCEELLAAERAAAAKLSADFAAGHEKRLMALEEYATARNTAGRERVRLRFELDRTKREWNDTVAALKQWKLNFLRKRLETAAAVSRAMSMSVDDEHEAAAASASGSSVPAGLRGLWEGLTDAELADFIVAACQTAGEMEHAEESKAKTCVPLRLAGLDVPLRWEPKTYEVKRVDKRETETEDDADAVRLLADILDYNHRNAEKVWTDPGKKKKRDDGNNGRRSSSSSSGGRRHRHHSSKPTKRRRKDRHSDENRRRLLSEDEFVDDDDDDDDDRVFDSDTDSEDDDYRGGSRRGYDSEEEDIYDDEEERVYGDYGDDDYHRGHGEEYGDDDNDDDDDEREEEEKQDGGEPGAAAASSKRDEMMDQVRAAPFSVSRAAYLGRSARLLNKIKLAEDARKRAEEREREKEEQEAQAEAEGSEGEEKQEEEEETQEEEVDKQEEERDEEAVADSSLMEGIDPVALPMLKNKLQRTEKTIRRGFDYAASAKVLLDALQNEEAAAEQPPGLYRETLQQLATGTVGHGRLSAVQVWQILHFVVSDLPGSAVRVQQAEAGAAEAAEEGTCALPWSKMCPPVTVQRRSAVRDGATVRVPPAAVVEAAASFCRNQSAEAAEAAAAAAAVCGAENGDIAIPASSDLPDGYLGYFAATSRGDDDVLSHAFRELQLLDDDGDGDGDDGDDADATTSLRGDLHNLESEEERLDDEKSDLEKKLRDIDQSMGGADGAKFGADGELYTLRDTCHEVEAGKYTYEVCVFGSAKQKEGKGSSHGTNLGKWKGPPYERDPASGRRVWKWERGQKCWNGPERSATVYLTCGVENVVLSADEPDTCRYVFQMTSPIACDDDFRVANGL